MAVINIRDTVSLDGLIIPVVFQGKLYGGETLAHRFIISATQAGQEFALSGTVSGKFLREADMAEVALVGSATGGNAEITLTANCYLKPGRFTLSIYVTADGHTTALRQYKGIVARTSGNTVVDPSGEITIDVNTLINRIDTAVASIPANYSSLLATLAGTFSDSTPYPAGDYVWYNGTLYQFASDHPAGMWIGTDAMAAVIGDEISELKSAYTSGQRIKSQSQIVNGDRLQTGRVHITLTPDDFELMESGKYIYADETGVHFGTNPEWSIYSFKFGTHNIFPLTSPAGAYHYGERVVFRLDNVKRDTSVTNAVALACRFGESTYYVLTESVEGQYYTGEELIISVHNTEAVLESVSLTATVCRDFEDNVVCSKYLGLFDRIEVFGDSIFANYVSYPMHTDPTPTDIGNGVTAQFASLMGLPINNHAHTGATLSTLIYDDPKNIVQQVYDYVQASSTGHETGTPLYLIDGGTNDQYHFNLTNLGVYGSDDITTICGAIKNIIEVLTSPSFGAQPWQIVVTTPIPKGITWSTVGLASMDSELTAIGYAIYQIGLALGVNVINGYRSIFNNLDDPNAKYLMMPDDTHPSELGSLLYAHRIYNALGGPVTRYMDDGEGNITIQ